ncbi:MAG: heme o synthase [Anaerolineae bacterium]
MRERGTELRIGGTDFSSLFAYLEITKPLSVFLLAFTAVGAMAVAAGGQPIPTGRFLHAVAACALGCAGANTLTCYIDRDIDPLMERTKRRPLPTQRIYPPRRALYWGLFLSVLSLVLAWLINPLSCFWGLIGLLDNVLVYSLLAKRRSPLNVILGGFSGGVPALYGWAAVRNQVALTPLLIAALVVLWIPNHIWNLAIFHTKDYRRVKVPMLPAVYSFKATVRCIVATVLLMFGCSIALYFVGGFGRLYLVAALVLGAAVAAGNLWLSFRPSRELAWRLFKLSSPYLFLLFTAMMLDVLV